MTTKKNDLEIFVDRLFANHRKTKAVIELRDEVLSNLEAKVNDYLEQGMEYAQAVHLAIRDIEAVDHLIDDHQTVDMTAYRLDIAQTALLYFAIAWILTIPARLLALGTAVNSLFMLLVATTGIVFIVLSRKQREGDGHKESIDTGKLKRLTRIVWILWGIFALVVTLFTLLTRFGSDVWFGRSMQVNGPYGFYAFAVQLLLPLLTVIIPLLFQHADKRITKYEVNEQ